MCIQIQPLKRCERVNSNLYRAATGNLCRCSITRSMVLVTRRIYCIHRGTRGVHQRTNCKTRCSGQGSTVSYSVYAADRLTV